LLPLRKPFDTCGIRSGQTHFYAIDMEKNYALSGDPMDTIGVLNVDLASIHNTMHFGHTVKGLNFSSLIGKNRHGYAAGLLSIMEALAAESKGPFQIEFVFNIINNRGRFHIVQYKSMPDLSSEPVEIPADERHVFLTTDRVQGHGVIGDLQHAIVISPFNYSSKMHAEVVHKLGQMNEAMKGRGEKYVLVVPGRVGTMDQEWGINVDFPVISQAAVVVEYGYDIHGGPEIPRTRQEMTGGMYGSHFLYQMLGGAAEDVRIRELRMRGSQGTHFITNLITAGTIYLHIDPTKNMLDTTWFFTPPAGDESSAIFMKQFDSPPICYADVGKKVCVIK
jgi:hypothetical protein